MPNDETQKHESHHRRTWDTETFAKPWTQNIENKTEKRRKLETKKHDRKHWNMTCSKAKNMTLNIIENMTTMSKNMKPDNVKNMKQCWKQ